MFLIKHYIHNKEATNIFYQFRHPDFIPEDKTWFDHLELIDDFGRSFDITDDAIDHYMYPPHDDLHLREIIHYCTKCKTIHIFFKKDGELQDTCKCGNISKKGIRYTNGEVLRVTTMLPIYKEITHHTDSTAWRVKTYDTEWCPYSEEYYISTMNTILDNLKKEGDKYASEHNS